LGTLLSIIFMLTLTIWLLVEAMRRVLKPQPVHGEKMLIVAGMCLMFNLIQMKILHGGDTHYHLGGGIESGGHDHDHEGHGHSHEGGADDDDDY
jgi:Co/Zn/Cd efflux system component